MTSRLSGAQTVSKDGLFNALLIGFGSGEREAVQIFEFCNPVLREFEKSVPVFSLDGCRLRNLDGRRIVVDPVDSEFIVEMGAGGQARTAHITDDVTLVDTFSRGYIFPVSR